MDIETTQWYLDQWGIYQKNLPGVTLGVQAHAYITAVNGDRWCDIDADVFSAVDAAVCNLRKIKPEWADLIIKHYVFDYNQSMLTTWLARCRGRHLTRRLCAEELHSAVACVSGMLFMTVNKKHLTCAQESVSLQLS